MNLKRYYDAAQAANQKVQNLADQIDALFEADKTEDALKFSPELEKARADAKEMNALYITMQAQTQNDGDPAGKFVRVGADPEPKAVQDLRGSQAYTDAFFSAFRKGATPKSIANGMHPAEPYKVLLDALSETGGAPAGAEGGFLNPIEFDNMIKEQQRLAVDLAPYFNVETVNAYSGWRAMEVAAAALPFAEVVESAFPSGERIPEMESPTFKKIEFTLKKYGGYLPVASDLLTDSTAAIMQYLAKWCGRKVSLTNSSLLLAIVNAISPVVSVTDYRTVLTAVKTALNKSLDPAISVGAKIFCNQTGFDLMDQLVDGTGRPLLAPDPTNETVKRFKGREIVPLSDAQWANTDTNTKTRIAVGDGRELATMFQRAAGELSSTNIGGSAWRNDNVEIKYIKRCHVVAVDTAAMKLLSVTLPA